MNAKQRKKMLDGLNNIPKFESAWKAKRFDPPSLPCEHEDAVSQDDGTIYCPDCSRVFKEGSQY